MEIIPIKTRKITPPKDDIYDILDNYCTDVRDGDVLLITSKIVAIHQGLCVPIDSAEDKDELIKKEADAYIPRKECPGEHVVLTLKDNILIASAGIDESNSNNYYVLLPKDSHKEAEKICKYLKNKFSLKKLAVIVTDSHTTPLRYGTIGISTGFYGLEPLKDYRGKKDVFGREMKMSRSNVVDALSAIGVLSMGEGDEQTPMTILRDVTYVEFTEEETYDKLIIPIKEDIFFPLLKNFFKKY